MVFRLESLADEAGGKTPCLFRNALYHLMENRFLADLSVRKIGAEWADFAVCVHEGNRVARVLPDSVADSRGAIEAFRRIVGTKRILEGKPSWMVEAVIPGSESGEWMEWTEWARVRCVLGKASLE